MRATILDIQNHAGISKKESSAHLLRLGANSSMKRQTLKMINLKRTFATFVMLPSEPKVTLLITWEMSTWIVSHTYSKMNPL